MHLPYHQLIIVCVLGFSHIVTSTMHAQDDEFSRRREAHNSIAENVFDSSVRASRAKADSTGELLDVGISRIFGKLGLEQKSTNILDGNAANNLATAQEATDDAANTFWSILTLKERAKVIGLSALERMQDSYRTMHKLLQNSSQTLHGERRQLQSQQDAFMDDAKSIGYNENAERERVTAETESANADFISKLDSWTGQLNSGRLSNTDMESIARRVSEQKDMLETLRERNQQQLEVIAENAARLRGTMKTRQQALIDETDQRNEEIRKFNSRIAELTQSIKGTEQQFVQQHDELREWIPKLREKARKHSTGK